MPTVAPITDWGTAVMTSLAAALAMVMSAIPKIIGFLIILVIGWIIAGILSRAVAAILRMVRFNDLADRAGITGFVHNMGINTDASGVLAEIAKWFVRLITLVIAFDSLGLPAVSNVLNNFIMWLPQLVVALVVLVITGLIANAVGDLVRGAVSEAGFNNPGIIATIAMVAIWGFGIIVAVNQIGVAQVLVDTLFEAFVGALALAFALAFGLGGRDTAARIVEDLYNRSQSAAPQMRDAANNMRQQAQSQTDMARDQMNRGTSRTTGE